MANVSCIVSDQVNAFGGEVTDVLSGYDKNEVTRTRVLLPSGASTTWRDPFMGHEGL